MRIAGYLTLGVWAVAAQHGPTIRTDVNLVEIHARVTGADGRAIGGLKKEDFELFVDGVPQPVTVFQGEDSPVTAAIVIDNSASMARKRDEVIAAAQAFARLSNPQDEMLVVHFSDTPRFGLPPGKPFTSSPGELARAIEEFELGGSTALYDAILLARSQFHRATYNHKVLLVITDGGDNASESGIADVIRALVKDGAALYAVGISDPAEIEVNPGVLSELAKLTGGAAYFSNEIREVSRICQAIAQDIRREYTLGFAGADDGKYHSIRLMVKDPNGGQMEVRTRSGYYAAKPKSD